MTCYRNKPVSKKEIFNRIGFPVTQVGYKQLFIVSMRNYQLLVSYYTIVGYKQSNKRHFIVTDKKYSVTTNRQLTGINHKKQNHIEFVQQLEIILALHEKLYCNLY